MTKRQSTKTEKRRKRRARPLPKWLKEQKDIDDIARRRCLMVLSTLSGEKPVSDAIEEAGISRQLYYQLEERALNAMLRALSPSASSEDTASAGAVKRAQELEEKLARLEQDKRRSDRLLLLTRKLMGRGPLKSAQGRPKKKRPTSSATSTGSKKLSKPSSDSSTS